jgi:hypothetical protein
MVGHPKKRARREAGVPAHPWKEDPSLSSRPPFAKDNEMSMVHGAHSERRLAPLVAKFEEGILEVAPWTSRPAFAASVRAWAVAESMCELYRQHFDDGAFNAQGEPRAGLVQWDRAEARATKLRARLSLDPAALASLLVKISTVESQGGTQAEQERSALQREIADLDRQIAEAMQAKEIEK